MIMPVPQEEYHHAKYPCDSKAMGGRRRVSRRVVTSHLRPTSLHQAKLIRDMCILSIHHLSKPHERSTTKLPTSGQLLAYCCVFNYHIH